MGKLIWIASYPKSGNTWVRAFLHNFLKDADAPQDINNLRDLTAIESDAGRFKPFDPRPAHLLARADVARLRPLVHASLTEAFPDHVLVKTHNALVIEEGRPILTPAETAGAVYILRDPRDVAVSYADHLGLPLDRVIALMADESAMTGGTDEHVVERLGSWSSHVEGWTERPNPRLCVLRYEDLAADPVASFGTLARFLGAAPDPARLDRAIRFSRFDELAGQEASAGFIERPPQSARFFRSGRVGGWRAVLSAPQAAAIEARHGRVMRRVGYL